MQVSGIEVVAPFCVDPEKSKAWYADFLGVEATTYPSRCSCWEARPCFLRLGLPGQDAAGRACTSTLSVSTRRTKR